MDLKRFSEYKYPHDGAAFRSPARKRFAGIAAVIALVISVLAFPAGLLSWSVVAIAWLGVSKKLYVGPRYLISGRDIIYFNNVTHMALDEGAGRLDLKSASGKSFTLLRERFPTNARKTDKIKLNKANKFKKVSARLIERVLACAEEVELEGLSRKRVNEAQASGDA